MVARMTRIRSELTERTGMRLVHDPRISGGSVCLQDPVIDDVRILILGPYVTGFISMMYVGGETKADAKKLRDDLPWFAIRRDIEGKIVYEEILGRDLVDRVVTICEDLRADYRLNERLRAREESADVEDPVNDAGALVGIDPFRGLE